MSKRPIVTTGIALASAGLLVAALPAIAPPLTDRDIQVVAQVETDLSASATDLFSGFDPASLLEGFGLIEGLLGGGLDLGGLGLDGDFFQRLNDAWWSGIYIGPNDTDVPLNPRGTVSGLTGVAMVITEELAVILANAVGLEMSEEEIKPLVQGFYVGGPIIIGLLGFLILNESLGGPIPEDLVINFFGGGITELARTALLGQAGDSGFGPHINAFFDNGIVGLVNVITGGLIDGLFPDTGGDDDGDDEEEDPEEEDPEEEDPEEEDPEEEDPEEEDPEDPEDPGDEIPGPEAQSSVAQTVQRMQNFSVDPKESGVSITETFTESTPTISEEVKTGPVDETLGNAQTDPPAATAPTPSAPRADTPETGGLDIEGADPGTDNNDDGQGSGETTSSSKYVPPVIAGNSKPKEPNSNNWKKVFDRAKNFGKRTAPAE